MHQREQGTLWEDFVGNILLWLGSRVCSVFHQQQASHPTFGQAECNASPSSKRLETVRHQFPTTVRENGGSMLAEMKDRVLRLCAPNYPRHDLWDCHRCRSGQGWFWGSTGYGAHGVFGYGSTATVPQQVIGPDNGAYIKSLQSP